MKGSNTEAAKAFFNLLPIDHFLRAAQRAPKRVSYGFNDYNCIYGRDPEADPGDEFDGVQLVFVDEIWDMSEIEFFQSLMEAAESRIKLHEGATPEINKIISDIRCEMEKIGNRGENKKLQK